MGIMYTSLGGGNPIYFGKKAHTKSHRYFCSDTDLNNVCCIIYYTDYFYD